MSFNPRAPCGARLGSRIAQIMIEKFQSTRPVRGATVYGRTFLLAYAVSIHAPRAGRDVAAGKKLLAIYVSIHAPRAGRDRDLQVHING